MCGALVRAGRAAVWLTFCTSGNTLLNMGDSGASINITADALEYGLQKFLKLFGKDAESAELAEWFKGLQSTALKQTASVQCLGMRNPLPFDSIYQPTRVIVGPDEDEALPTESYAWDDRVSRSILRGRAFSWHAGILPGRLSYVIASGKSDGGVSAGKRIPRDGGNTNPAR
jgi:hypothetical protein